MASPRIRTTLAIAVSLICMGCASPPPTTVSSATPSVPSELTAYYTQNINWQPCTPATTCADIRVPVDYTAPQRGDTTVRIQKRAATSERQGALFFNPGGPGVSGAEYANVADFFISSDVLQHYDFIGVDPRGVGQSAPLECLTDLQRNSRFTSDPYPRTRNETLTRDQHGSDIASACHRQAGDRLAYMSTEQVARDFDVIRSALQEPQLNYLGKSYGSKLGLTYAELFPDRVGKIILDGILPTDLSVSGIAYGQALATEQALTNFLRWCLSRNLCPWSASGDATRTETQLRRWLQRLPVSPPTSDASTVTAGIATWGIRYGLASSPDSGWKELADAITAGFRGDGTPLQAILDARTGRDPDTSTYTTPTQDAFLAVHCLDTADTFHPAQYPQQMTPWWENAPTFGPALAWDTVTCSHWPYRQPPTVTATELPHPILLLNYTDDSITPVSWAHRVHRTLPNSTLATVNGVGHSVYRSGSACADRIVDDYLLNSIAANQRVITCNS